MDIDRFGEILKEHGITHGSGVPCSFFTPLVNYMGLDPGMDYISAASEGEAVAIAAGLVTAGKPAFALMQNSGLGNAVNPITSMLHPFQIPVVLLVSHRGEPGRPDEPQHELMGQITEELVQLCGLDCHVLRDEQQLAATLRSAQESGTPAAFVCRKGMLSGGRKAAPLQIRVTVNQPRSGQLHTLQAVAMREQLLQAILPILNRSEFRPAVIATTGMLSRELYELDDRDHQRSNRFYMVGSMGCASGFGLGVARAQPQRDVIILDGDGALLMKMGTMATIGAQHAARLRHVMVDNGAHDSTGGQPTASPQIDFGQIALACGYRRADTVSDPDRFAQLLDAHLQEPGPTFLRVLARTGSRADLGRPTLSPRDCWLRFRTFLEAS